MTATRYPPAVWLGNGKSGGSWVSGYPYRLVLHTTEGTTLPGYDNGYKAPHVTYDPETRTFYQHREFGDAARALLNVDGGVQTNRARSLQLEIITCSDKAWATKIGGDWVGDLPESAYLDLADFVRWCHLEFGIALRWPNRRAFSSAEANASGFRMSESTWTSFDGVCSHQHVTENIHWDTGALDIAHILDLAEEADLPLNDADKEWIANAIDGAINDLLAKDEKGTSRLSRALWQHGGTFAEDDPDDNAQRTLVRVDKNTAP